METIDTFLLSYDELLSQQKENKQSVFDFSSACLSTDKIKVSVDEIVVKNILKSAVKVNGKSYKDWLSPFPLLELFDLKKPTPFSYEKPPMISKKSSADISTALDSDKGGFLWNEPALPYIFKEDMPKPYDFIKNNQESEPFLKSKKKKCPDFFETIGTEKNLSYKKEFKKQGPNHFKLSFVKAIDKLNEQMSFAKFNKTEKAAPPADFVI